jgi:hypothetical protein
VVDRYTPLKTMHSLARSLGLSPLLLRIGARYIGSPSRMRRCFTGYQPTCRDVFVCTFLKSGTNWMMQIAVQIAWQGRAEFEHIHDLVAWPDCPEPGPIPLEDPRAWEGCPTGLRVIKTHADQRCVPWSEEARYLVVLRDPKEVMVSAYHFAAPLLGISETLDPQQWLEILMSDQRGLTGGWLEHTLSWWAVRDRPNVLVLTYPEMKRDLPGAVRAVAARLGVELDEAALAAVVERSGLAWMKANNERFAPARLPFIEPDYLPQMVRRGAAGGADELYSARDLAALDRAVLDRLAELGSDFPYRRLFHTTAPDPE